MAFAELNVEIRQGAGKGVAHKLRAASRIPAVLYGAGRENTALSLDPHFLKKLILAAPTRTFLLNLNFGGTQEPAMLKEIQVHPVSRKLLHADFLRVQADKPVTMQVAVDVQGAPVGLLKGGMLDVRARFVEVTALPGQMPQRIGVDVSKLNLGDAIKAADLALPEGVKIEAEPGLVICSVIAQSMAESAAPAPVVEGEAAAPEKEEPAKKGK